MMKDDERFTDEQQETFEALSQKQRKWLNDPVFIRMLGLKLGLMWQERAVEKDAKFHEHWDKLSFYEKYIKPL
jgi:hypothetical protein